MTQPLHTIIKRQGKDVHMYDYAAPEEMTDKIDRIMDAVNFLLMENGGNA